MKSRPVDWHFNKRGHIERVNVSLASVHHQSRRSMSKTRFFRGRSSQERLQFHLREWLAPLEINLNIIDGDVYCSLCLLSRCPNRNAAVELKRRLRNFYSVRPAEH